MPKFTLLSIKPKYADRIYAGTKRYEFRRRLPVRRELPILIYESAPVQRVTGIVPLARYLTASPVALWNLTATAAGIDRDTFDTYFLGSDMAGAIEILSVYRLDAPLRLGERGVPNKPPQSFCYADIDL